MEVSIRTKFYREFTERRRANKADFWACYQLASKCMIFVIEASLIISCKGFS